MEITCARWYTTERLAAGRIPDKIASDRSRRPNVSIVRRMDAELLADLAKVTNSDQQRAVRAQLAADLIRLSTLARWVGIYTVADGMVTNEAWSGPAQPAHPAFPVTDGLTGHAVRARSLAVSNDVGSDPRYLANQPDSGSELILPVIVGGHVVGTLDVESDTLGAFEGAEIIRCERLAAALRPLWHPADPETGIRSSVATSEHPRGPGGCGQRRE